VTSTAASNTLLTYAMNSNPYPLEVSESPTSPSIANLTFVVSCPRSVGECTVNQIVIHLPVGDVSDATNLTPTAPPASAASIASSSGAQWTPSAGVGAGTFVFTPPNGSAVISSDSLTIQINGIQVSPFVGTATITISEWAAPGTYTPPPLTNPPSGQATIAASKFPYGFYAFDFTANTPQIQSGETATLTWVGSDNAAFTMAYGDTSGIQVSGEEWTSPPLYTTTVFILTATASEAGQTVHLDLTTTVVVASPQVIEFSADPSSIDYNQTVTLEWRAVDADGVYLLTGQSGKLQLPPASDPKNPQHLQPVYGGSYSLQAYKTEGATEVVSPAVPLAYTFNAMQIASFAANPPSVDVNNQQTTVSWNVLHAKSVAYQGQTVDATSSAPESPTVPSTTYNLVATWVDGSTQQSSVTVPAGVVHVDGYSVQFSDADDGWNVTVTFQAENLTGITIPRATMLCSDRHHWYIWGNHYETSPVTGTGQQVDATHWQVPLSITVPGNFLGYLDVPNVGLSFDWSAQGWIPQGATGNIVMYRGSLTFWNGS
jgi:hypothetical protein